MKQNLHEIRYHYFFFCQRFGHLSKYRRTFLISYSVKLRCDGELIFIVKKNRKNKTGMFVFVDEGTKRTHDINFFNLFLDAYNYSRST